VLTVQAKGITREISKRESSFSFPGEMAIEKSKLVTTLPSIGKEYRISFDLLVAKHTSGNVWWRNVIHLTTGGNDGTYGFRTPGVWIFKTNKLHVSSALNGNHNSYFDFPKQVKEFQVNTLHISQNFIDNKYIFEIQQNGETMYSVENKQATEFKNVKMYVGDPWYTPVDGKLRNILVTVGADETADQKVGALSDRKPYPDFPLEIPGSLVLKLQRSSTNEMSDPSCSSGSGFLESEHVVDYENIECIEGCNNENKYFGTCSVPNNYTFKFNKETGDLEQSTDVTPGTTRSLKIMGTRGNSGTTTTSDPCTTSFTTSAATPTTSTFIPCTTTSNPISTSPTPKPEVTTTFRPPSFFHIPYWRLSYCPLKINNIEKFPICCLHYTVYNNKNTKPFCCETLGLQPC